MATDAEIDRLIADVTALMREPVGHGKHALVPPESAKTEGPDTRLHVAVLELDFSRIESLIRERIDPHITDREGLTAYEVATAAKQRSRRDGHDDLAFRYQMAEHKLFRYMKGLETPRETARRGNLVRA